MTLEQKQDVLLDAFLEWKQHPVTVQFVKNLIAHRKSYIDRASNESMNSSTDDASIRRYAINMKNTEAIIAMIANYEAFTKYMEK